MCKIICSTTLVTHKSNNSLQNFRVVIDVYTKIHKSLYQKNLDEINRYNKLNCRHEIRRKFQFRRGSFGWGTDDNSFVWSDGDNTLLPHQMEPHVQGYGGGVMFWSCITATGAMVMVLQLLMA